MESQREQKMRLFLIFFPLITIKIFREALITFT
jgi:hypothetical protein